MGEHHACRYRCKQQAGREVLDGGSWMEDGRREVEEGASLFVILCARLLPRDATWQQGKRLGLQGNSIGNPYRIQIGGAYVDVSYRWTSLALRLNLKCGFQNRNYFGVLIFQLFVTHPRATMFLVGKFSKMFQGFLRLIQDVISKPQTFSPFSQPATKPTAALCGGVACDVRCDASQQSGCLYRLQQYYDDDDHFEQGRGGALMFRRIIPGGISTRTCPSTAPSFGPTIAVLRM